MKQALYLSDATWPQQSETLKEQGITRTGKLPALEYKGQILTQVSSVADAMQSMGRVFDNGSTFLSSDTSPATLEVMREKRTGRNMSLTLCRTFTLIGG